MESKEIKVTNNYEMFKILAGNRGVSPARVKKIKKSIEDVGYITSPILVNEKMEVIDGQRQIASFKRA